MRYFIFVLMIFWSFFSSVSAFEPQCFREMSVVDTASGVLAFSIQNVDDDLFFVQ